MQHPTQANYVRRSVIKLQHGFQRLRHPAEQKIDASIKIVNKKSNNPVSLCIFGVTERASELIFSSCSHLGHCIACKRAAALLTVGSRVHTDAFYITRITIKPPVLRLWCRKKNHFAAASAVRTPDGRSSRPLRYLAERRCKG